jgi:hypothetical protein
VNILVLDLAWWRSCHVFSRFGVADYIGDDDASSNCYCIVLGQVI